MVIQKMENAKEKVKAKAKVKAISKRKEEPMKIKNHVKTLIMMEQVAEEMERVGQILVKRR